MKFWTVLLILLVALLIVVVVAFAAYRARRQPAAAGAQSGYTGFAGSSAEWPATPRQYNPMKVGNDASARPWEDETIPVQDTVHANWKVPPGFDINGFLVVAKRNFVTLQDAWDRSDAGTLRAMMTDEMLDEISAQIADRDGQDAAAAAQRTEVAMLDAQLLGIEQLGDKYLATVEFSGMIREEPSAGASPFREVWNMVKPKDGSAGWLVAGVQALQ